MLKYSPLLLSLLFINCSFWQNEKDASIEDGTQIVSSDSSTEAWHKNIDYTLADSFKVDKLRTYSASWNSACLPMPIGKFLLRNYQGEPGYDYLVSNFDSLTSKVSTEKEKSAGTPCSWKQKFKSGFSYSTNSCKEGSATYEIHTECTDKRALIQLIDVLFYRSLNSWDSDSSNYAPILEGPGSYFSIEKNDKGFYDVEYTIDG